MYFNYLSNRLEHKFSNIVHTWTCSSFRNWIRTPYFWIRTIVHWTSNIDINEIQLIDTYDSYECIEVSISFSSYYNFKKVFFFSTSYLEKEFTSFPPNPNCICSFQWRQKIICNFGFSFSYKLNFLHIPKKHFQHCKSFSLK